MEHPIGQSVNRRSRFEIYLDLLQAVPESRTTLIGHRAGLSWTKTTKYLKSLERQGLIRTVKGENGGNKYELTRRGFEVIETLRKVTDAFAPRVRT